MNILEAPSILHIELHAQCQTRSVQVWALVCIASSVYMPGYVVRRFSNDRDFDHQHFTHIFPLTPPLLSEWNHFRMAHWVLRLDICPKLKYLIHFDYWCQSI